MSMFKRLPLLFAGRKSLLVLALLGLTPSAVPQIALWGPLSPPAGTPVPALSIEIVSTDDGPGAVPLSDSFSAFLVDRYLYYEFYIENQSANGLVPGAEVTQRAIFNLFGANDRISLRLDLTDETLPFENRSYTYDEYTFPGPIGDLVPGGPLAIAPSAIGTDISGNSTGKVTLDLPPERALQVLMTGTVPATANIGDTGSFNFWFEPLVPETSLAGTSNADAHSLVQTGNNTLMGVETEVFPGDTTYSALRPESGAAAYPLDFTLAVPEIELVLPVTVVSELTDPAACAVEPAVYPAFRVLPGFPALPGRCLAKTMSFRNRGLVATDNFPLVIQVPPELTYVGLTVGTGLVDGPAAGVGPVIIDTDESGGPCSATSLNCEVRIEDASLPAQARVFLELRGLIR